jgi:transposase-like protein
MWTCPRKRSWTQMASVGPTSGLRRMLPVNCDVTASFAPGTSVSTVACQCAVNANQVFGWRRRVGPSSAVVQQTPAQTRPKLVPVTVSTEAETASLAVSASVSDSGIEIEVAVTYRIRVRANFDCRVLLRSLSIRYESTADDAPVVGGEHGRGGINS